MFCFFSNTLVFSHNWMVCFVSSCLSSINDLNKSSMWYVYVLMVSKVYRVFFLPHLWCTDRTPKFTEYENLYSVLNFLLNAAHFVLILPCETLETLTYVWHMTFRHLCSIHKLSCVNNYRQNPNQDSPFGSLGCLIITVNGS